MSRIRNSVSTSFVGDLIILYSYIVFCTNIIFTGKFNVFTRVKLD